jgi:hypothetical protein
MFKEIWLQNLRHKWYDNIKMNLEDSRSECVHCIQIGQWDPFSAFRKSSD